MNEPNANWYYDQVIANPNINLTPQAFASICHMFRAAGYNAGIEAGRAQVGEALAVSEVE